jgi:electron transport complex protein RnfD
VGATFEEIKKSSPHIKSKNTTTQIMIDVLLALMPALFAGLYFFGENAAKIVLISVVVSVVTELLFNLITKKPITITDFSAVVTGLLFALTLPANTPIYAVVLGAFVAIFVGKMLFGGIGKNFANPALVGRLFVVISFGSLLSAFIDPIDGIAGATPLVAINAGDLSSINLLNLFLGSTGGCIGETSTLALLLGGIYLSAKRIIDIRIPLIFLGGSAVLAFAFSGSINFVLPHLMAGGLMLGAIFMATDYTTSPISDLSIVIYALGCAILTMVIRFFGSQPEGVSYAILLMNLLVPLLDKYVRPNPYGRGAKNE